MKRSQRRVHRMVWPIVVLCAGMAVGLGLAQRSPSPDNPVWPPLLLAAARP